MISKVQLIALLALTVPAPALSTETPAAAAPGLASVTLQDRQPNKRGVLDLGLGLDASPYGYAGHGGPAVGAPVAVSKVSYATAHYPKQVIAGYGGSPSLTYAAPGIAYGGPVTYADAPYYSKVGYAAAPLGYLDGGISYAGYPGLSYNGYAAIPAPGLGYGALPY